MTTAAYHEFPTDYSVQPYEMYLKWNLPPNLFVFVDLVPFSFEKMNNSNSSEGKNNGSPPFWRWTETGDKRWFFIFHPITLYNARGVKTCFFSSDMAGKELAFQNLRQKCKTWLSLLQPKLKQFKTTSLPTVPLVFCWWRVWTLVP